MAGKTNLIRDDLLELQYYFDRLSKFMLESYGINEQVKTFWAQLKQANEVLSEFLYEMDIFYISNQGVEPESNLISGTLLDNLGKIFNCYRNFTIPERNANDEIIGYNKINFKNKDKAFLTYIKTQIIKQNFDGTRENLRELYSTYEDGKLIEGILKDINFIYFLPNRNPRVSAICTIYWDADADSLDENLKILFENGYLTIESIGIQYTRSILELSKILSFIEIDTPYEDTVFEIWNYLYYRNGEVYILLSSEPSNWGTGEYYSLTTTVLSSWPAQWQSNTYFRKDGSNLYILSLSQPYEWEDDNYLSRYYTVTKSLVPSGTPFQTDTYYRKLTEIGGILG